LQNGSSIHHHAALHRHVLREAIDGLVGFHVLGFERNRLAQQRVNFG